MTYRHIEGVTVKADFSRDRKYRYSLEIVRIGCHVDGRTACVIMQNPSYANEEIADRSVQFMEKIVFTRNLPEFAGVNRLIVVNLFAYIQTRGFEPSPEKIGHRNMQVIEAAIRESQCVILAWGSSPTLAQQSSSVSELLKKHPGKMLYKTRSHPVTGSYERFIEAINETEVSLSEPSKSLADTKIGKDLI